jgi:hypothetical protein
MEMAKSNVQGVAVLAIVGIVGLVAGIVAYEAGAGAATRDWSAPASGVHTPYRDFMYNMLAPLGV